MSSNHGYYDFDIDVYELDEEHPRMPTPPNATIKLKPHQQTLLARCKQFEDGSILLKEFQGVAENHDAQDYMKTNMAILGDRVGAGKSYVILSLIISNDITCKANDIIKSHGHNKVLYYFHDRSMSIKTNLLVIPHNLSTQWEYYIKSFGCNLTYKIVKTQKIFDALMSDIIETNEDTGRESIHAGLSKYDIIVVTSTLYNKMAHILTRYGIKVQRAIYDEVDSLNIPGAKHIESNFIWFVTASYGNVLYPKGHHQYDSTIGRYIWYANGIKHNGFVKSLLMDLWYNVGQSLMKILVIKNKESYVEQSLALPELISHYIRCKTPHAIHVLNGIVDRQLLNHLNADDIQGALSYISPANRTNNEENIISRVVEKYSRQMNNIQLQINMAREYQYDTPAEQAAELQKLQRNLESVQSKIDMITERIRTSDLCTICYDVAEKKTITTCCQNAFCFKCISIWLTQRKLCPLCKISMNLSDIYVLDETAKEPDNASESEQEVIDPTKPRDSNDKYQNLEVILGNLRQNAKVLIFSSYESSFTNIVEILNRMNWTYSFLKGNGFHIQATIQRYKGDEVKVLLINTQNYGQGMNLENTTDLILFHKFDTEVEKQVIGRAQRYGRHQPLHVHYLLYDNEMPQQ